MSTYRELVNICLDELKALSDDSTYQQEHVLFLLDKYRGFILKKTYDDAKKEIPESNYQTVCVDLEQVNDFEGDNCGGNGYLRSTKEIPELMTIGNTTVGTTDYFHGNITYVSRERFKYVGNNKYLQNIIYSTIAPNSHLYLKSNNPQAYYLNKVKVTGIFEDPAKASELSCDDAETACDVLDRNYPLEEALVPSVIELIVKELGGVIYKPADGRNDANDDLDAIATFLSRNLKKNWERDGDK